MRTPSAEALLADIRAKCLDCCCGSRKQVEECTSRECRLWKHRKGLAGVQMAAILPEDTLEGQMDMFEMVV